jgi:hypothetical protein
MEDNLEVTLRLEAEADADADELDRLTQLLREQVLQLDVQSAVPLSAGAPPPGTRAGDMLMLGGLLVTLTRSPELLKVLVSVVQSWLGNRAGRTVELQIGGDSIKVAGIGSYEQQRLIQLFVERHVS